MANEITYFARLKVAKGLLILDRNPSSSSNGLKADMAGTHMSHNVQNIATTAAGVLVTVSTGVATLGFSMVTNLDTTNYVEVGVQVSGTFYPLLRLKPGESQLVRFSASATLYARSNTAACDVEFLILEA